MSGCKKTISETKVLALHFGALGDFVLSWPALGLLAAGPPPARLSLICRRSFGELILPASRVRDREALSLTHLFTDHPDPELDAWLAGFDLAVVFGQRPDPALIKRLAAAGVSETWTIPTRPSTGSLVHVGDLQVGALREKGLKGAAKPPKARMDDPPPHNRPVLAPGSGGKAKRLPPSSAADVLARMAGEFGSPILLTGPAEDQAYTDEILRMCPAQGVSLVSEPSLEELAQLLAGAGLYVGADSGVTHLAAALGTPTMAAFGPTDARIWGPRGPKVRVTSMEGLEKTLEQATKQGPDFFLEDSG